MTTGARAAALALALVTLSAGCSHASPPSPARAEPHVPSGPVHHVVLVTLDGLLPEAYEHPDAHGLRVPTLRWLVSHGASTPGAFGVFPTVTYPSHTSMVTGVVPAKHGITSNRTFDPLEDDLGGWRWYAEDIKREPVWSVAERNGLPAALVSWPVSVGARVTWLVPEYWRAKNENDPKLLRALSTPGLLEAVAKEHPEFASMYKPPDVKDEILTDIAIHILAEGKPALLLLHLVEVDGAQHHTGLWSPESVRAIEEDDRQLARVFHALDVDGLSKDTNVIVASDHGFMNAAHAVRPGTLLREAGLVTLNAAGHVTDWKATLVVNSGSAYAYLHDASDKASLEQLKALFNGKASDPTSGIGRVYGADEVRALGGDPAASLAIEAAPDFMLVEGYAGPFAAPGNYRATHGYDPSRPEMRPSLLMVGPTVPHGTLVDPHLVDIGPTIASWLGLSMAGVDGKVLGVTTTP